MRSLIFIFITFLFIGFLSCNSKAPKQPTAPLQDTVGLDTSDIKTISTAIKIFNSYNDQDAEEARESASYIAAKIHPSNANAASNEKIAYDKNLVNVKQLSSRALVLLNNGKYHELMVLLDENINNFRSHPANTIETEKILHDGLIVLYFKFYSYDVALNKTISLYEFSKFHYQGIEAMSGRMKKSYPNFLSQLADTYNLKGDYANAIKTYKEDLDIIRKIEGEQCDDYKYILKKISETTEMASKNN